MVRHNDKRPSSKRARVGRVAREDRRGLRRHGLRERHPRRRGLGAADADFLVDAYALNYALEVAAAGDFELHGGQRAGGAFSADLHRRLPKSPGSAFRRGRAANLMRQTLPADFAFGFGAFGGVSY